MDTLVDCTEFISNVLEERKHAVGVFIDYSKAFDTVSHIILLDKLEKYGLRGKSLYLIKSYLANRRQCVKNKRCSFWW